MLILLFICCSCVEVNVVFTSISEPSVSAFFLRQSINLVKTQSEPSKHLTRQSAIPLYIRFKLQRNSR